MTEQQKIKAGVYGASGYAGQDVIEILSHHPCAEVVFGTSTTYAGQDIPFTDLKYIPHDTAPLDDVEVVFLALPHGVSAQVAKKALDAGKRVVDLSADFRLDTPPAQSSELTSIGIDQHRCAGLLRSGSASLNKPAVGDRRAVKQVFSKSSKCSEHRCYQPAWLPACLKASSGKIGSSCLANVLTPALDFHRHTFPETSRRHFPVKMFRESASQFISHRAIFESPHDNSR